MGRVMSGLGAVRNSARTGVATVCDGAGRHRVAAVSNPRMARLALPPAREPLRRRRLAGARRVMRRKEGKRSGAAELVIELPRKKQEGVNGAREVDLNRLYTGFLYTGFDAGNSRLRRLLRRMEHEARYRDAEKPEKHPTEVSNIHQHGGPTLLAAMHPGRV